MADIQKQFERFHSTIRIDYSASEPLREKRDILVEKIKKSLRDRDRRICRVLLQGSYAMKTGVIPTPGLEYDIDVGLRFFMDEEDEFSAADVRAWVWEAVKDHTNDVDNKGPCIRVNYSQKDYHVDLVVYEVWEQDDETGTYRLGHKDLGWRSADPPGLDQAVKTAREPFGDLKDTATLTDQFRRCVRYLRRWVDVAIPEESEDKPSGLAFVLLCRDLLEPKSFLSEKPDDRGALEALASKAASSAGRIEAFKPTPEYEDMFGGLSQNAMDELKERFGDMHSALQTAAIVTDPVEACKEMQKIFGDDFPDPDPDPEDTAKATPTPAIITSSSSA